MKNYLNVILLVLATAFLSNIVKANPDTLPAKGKAVLDAGKIKEVCFSAKPPMKINYQFSTTKPLNFNIHFHKSKKVFFPIKQNNILGTQGIFTPKSEQFYCMMWENNTKDSINLTFSAKLN